MAQRVRSRLTHKAWRSKSLFHMLLHLFFILAIFIVGDVEVTELVGLLVRSNHAEPVTDLVLLQELLRKVLEVALGERNVGDHSDLVVGTTANRDSITQVVCTAINLDAVVKELLL